MVRKKIDNRIRVLIENGVKLGHRTLFLIVGQKSRDQVVILHHMLTKAEVRARPSVLWCYKKELGFSSHRKKRMKHLQHKIQAGRVNVNEDDPFELFVSSTKIRYCYYSETHKILGNTFGMCVLQDFEGLTPNLLARTVETVEGGGLVVLLLRSITSLRQLTSLTMDIHQRYKTEAHQGVVCRFNERFLRSVASCRQCLVVDDRLEVLPFGRHNLDVVAVAVAEKSAADAELVALKNSLSETQPVGKLVGWCKTLDQAKALLKFVESVTEKTLRATVSLTAARGRGKSATLGLAVAAAVAFGYANIFVTSPSPENLNTFFEFVFKGFEVLEYQEHIDYDSVRSTSPEFNKAVVRVNIFRDHKQTIQYIQATESSRLTHAELLVIDEAAAIPLPFVRAMLGPYLVFLASTINGYEGTGRSLSLKLLQQLRIQTTSDNHSKDTKKNSRMSRTLHEVGLEESIRYKAGDEVERWLNELLCLSATTTTLKIPGAGNGGLPPVESCDLYYINRDTLFSYHKASEEFLQRLVALYVASHYKNTPNDLQMMSDAPAHHLFCLLAPVPVNTALPEVLVFIQVCVEGQISRSTVLDGMTREKKASGDLIPWTLGQQFQDPDFPKLNGLRIVRIATHPDCQGIGYGRRAIELLKQYYELKLPLENDALLENIPVALAADNDDDNDNNDNDDDDDDDMSEMKSLAPLLLKVSERRPERIDYIGVSYGLTEPLLRFWKKTGFVPVYLRQTTNDLTGEHSCIMLYVLNYQNGSWLTAYSTDFRRRFLSLLSYQFSAFSVSLALGVLTNKSIKLGSKAITKPELDVYLTKYDVNRLQMYTNNRVDYHLIIDLIPQLAKIYFFNLMGDVKFSAVQSAILLGIGLQNKTVETLSTELDLPASQLLGIFNKVIRRSVEFFHTLLKDHQTNSEQLQESSHCPKKMKRKKKKLKELQENNSEPDDIPNSEVTVEKNPAVAVEFETETAKKKLKKNKKREKQQML